MKYITYRVHTSIVRRDIRVKHTYFESFELHSMVMSYDRTDAMIFDTEEEIKPAIINHRKTQYDDYNDIDYKNENWIIKPITEKAVFIQRLTQ